MYTSYSIQGFKLIYDRNAYCGQNFPWTVDSYSAYFYEIIYHNLGQINSVDALTS
jgi:hypothetical protein